MITGVPVDRRRRWEQEEGRTLEPASGVVVNRRVVCACGAIVWPEAKLEANGVGKVIPGDKRLEVAYRRAYQRALLNRAMKDANAEAARLAREAEVPADLATKVERRLRRDRARTWDDAVGGIAKRAAERRRGGEAA
jgi:hypothetical protein